MKMLDYLAAGVPVVSTAVGARGLELEPGRDVHIAPLHGFELAVRGVLEERAELADARAIEVRRRIEERFDWAAVAQRLLDAIGAEEPASSHPALARPATIA